MVSSGGEEEERAHIPGYVCVTTDVQSPFGPVMYALLLS